MKASKAIALMIFMSFYFANNIHSNKAVWTE